jgi:bacteriocin biosynthesis cyclodehydratase domain-containing protein
MKIHILHLGVFAADAAQRIAAASADHDVVVSDLHRAPNGSPAFWPRSELRILITGRESRHLSALLDESVYETSTPAVSMTLDHPRLRLGPVVLPDQGPCSSCASRRRQQHDSSYRKAAALYAAYDNDPALEPHGHLPHQAGLAAAWATCIIDDTAAGHLSRHSGVIRQLNLQTGAVSSDRVVGVHGCTRCRHTPPLEQSSWAFLSADLAAAAARSPQGASRG